jgi:hypothetical protein
MIGYGCWEQSAINCDLFIRGYWKDLGWLALCLASVRRYCHGFRDTVVVLPRSSDPWLRRRGLPRVGRIEWCRDYRDDYLGQQATKLMADSFTDADFICHVDCDCIFIRPTSPENFIVGERPRVFKRPIELLGRERPWQAPTEKFLGWQVRDDFMYYPPFTFPRWLYALLREHTLTEHGMDLETYILAQPPRGFSEFNALGAFAWERCRDRFLWVEATVVPPRDAHCRWYWSWGGLDAKTRAEIEGFLEPHLRTI